MKRIRQIIKTRKGDLELDEIGKLLLALILLLILIAIVTLIFIPGFETQSSDLKGIFNFFK